MKLSLAIILLFGVQSGRSQSDPASVNCQEIGGRILNQHTTEGEDYTVCMFEDGSVCEAEALYDGECEKGSMPTFEDFCTEKGGLLMSHDNFDEDGEWLGYMSCTFADGMYTTCDEDTYYFDDGCESEYRRSRANIKCVGPIGLDDVDDMASVCAARGDMYTELYECDDGTNACCTDSDLDNPSMPQFGGQCHRVVPTRRVKKRLVSIECIQPSNRLSRMSHAEACDSVDDEHNYRYKCDDEDETLLCCNNSLLTDPNFEDNWGLCHKIEENEEE